MNDVTPTLPASTSESSFIEGTGWRLPIGEIEFSAIRAQGAGGQNINKVSNAAHLRFDIRGSSLPPAIRDRLLALRDQRISADGVLVIKAQRHRSLARNRDDALTRLAAIIDAAAEVPIARRATRPTRASQQRRVDEKTHRGRIKAVRGRVDE